jgi:pimeloyl-ACP methyl ester carboxylesterase
MLVWRQLLDARPLTRPVITLDLPGHGASDNAASPSITYSFPGYAGAVAAVLDALGVKSVDVVGWSLGGHVGLQLLAVDDRVRSLLIAGTPPAPLHPESLESAFYPSDRMCLAGQRVFSKADALAYGTAMMGGRINLPDDLLACVERTDGLARHFMFENALRGIGIDQREIAESTPKPLCIVHGDCDPFVRLDYLQSLVCKNLFENRVFVVEGAGHAPHWSHTPEFRNILSAFGAFVESGCY